MPDYKLEGLSPRSFEQLVQSIAAKVIGPIIRQWSGAQTKVAAELIERVWDVLPADAWELARGAIDAGRQIVRSQQSALGSRNVWADLQLPRSLDSLLPEATSRN